MKPTVTTTEDSTGHQIMAEKPKDMPKTGGVAGIEPPVIKRITLAEYTARRKSKEAELRASTAAATMDGSHNAAIGKPSRDRTAEFIASGAKLLDLHTLLDPEDCDVHNRMQRHQQQQPGHGMAYAAGHHGRLTAFGPTRSPYAGAISQYQGRRHQGAAPSSGGGPHYVYDDDATSCFIGSPPRGVGTARPPAVAGAVSYPTKGLNDNRARDLFYGGVARSQNGAGSNTLSIARPPSNSSDSGRVDMRPRRYDHYSPAYDHYAPAYDHYAPAYGSGGQRQGHMGRGAAASNRRPSVDSGYSSSSDRARKEEVFNERHNATGANATAAAGRRGAVERAVGKGSEPAITHSVKRKRAHNDDDDIGQGETKRPSGTGCSQRAQYPNIYRGIYSRRG